MRGCSVVPVQRCRCRGPLSRAATVILDGRPLGAEGLSKLAEADVHPRLRKLSLAYVTTAKEQPKWNHPKRVDALGSAWRALFAKSWPRLESVNLEANFLGLFGGDLLGALFATRAWPQVTELNLAMNEIRDVTFSAPLFAKVERLSLRHNPLKRATVASLAKSSLRLKHLDLGLTNIDLKSVRALLHSKVAEPLESLALDNLFLGDKLVEVLRQESKRLQKLRVLHLGLNKFRSPPWPSSAVRSRALKELKISQQTYPEEWP